jgi:hypothetical protein
MERDGNRNVFEQKLAPKSYLFAGRKLIVLSMLAFAAYHYRDEIWQPIVRMQQVVEYEGTRARLSQQLADQLDQIKHQLGSAQGSKKPARVSISLEYAGWGH